MTPRLSPAPPQDPVASTSVSRAYLGAVGSRASREEDEVGMTVPSQPTATPHSMPEKEATGTAPDSPPEAASTEASKLPCGGNKEAAAGLAGSPATTSENPGPVLFRCNS